MPAPESFIEIGRLSPGAHNAITDVADVRVGHATLIEGDDIRMAATPATTRCLPAATGSMATAR
jgi:L-aminopeptidase/D-esterase-like protein